MSLKIDRLQLEIIINNDQSRKQLRELNEEATKIQKELKKIPQGTDEWIKKSERLKVIKIQMDGIYEKIGLTGLSLKELSARQRELNMILANMDPRLPRYKEYRTQLDAVNHRIAELKGKAKEAGLSLSSMANGFNKYFMMVTTLAASLSGLIMDQQH